MTDPVLLAAEHVTCRVDGRVVLSEVSVDLREGERVALLGPSGSGKTTLLTTMAGLQPAHRGRVRFRDRYLDEEPARRRDIALVLQTYGLLPLLTAAENVELALRAAGRRPKEARAAAALALQDLDLGSMADRLVEELSGGQEQRVAVARAVAGEPIVVLADEPTAEQDAEHRDLVLQRLFTVAERTAGLLVATHDVDVAKRCDRVVGLRDGRLVPDPFVEGPP